MQSQRKQSAVIALVRDNLSDEVVNRLRNMIVDGTLPAGERINEVHLSRDLGVSRTPLREALSRLVHEGAIRGVPRIGYFVRELTLQEFENIYAIRPILEPEALRLAGLPSRERLERLVSLNDRIGKAKHADAVIDLDDEWHNELIADCPNSVLLEFIRQIISRTRRYEIALMRERRNIAHATRNHRSIMTALRRRDLDAACDELRKNLQWGRAPIVAWLESIESTEAE
jgi:DNA-binding GntR family transcriptional regulator